MNEKELLEKNSELSNEVIKPILDIIDKYFFIQIVKIHLSAKAESLLFTIWINRSVNCNSFNFSILDSVEIIEE